MKITSHIYERSLVRNLIVATASSYCGLAILHSLMYKKVADAQYRSKLSNELMMYHMKVSTIIYIDLELDTNDPTH